MLVKVGEVIIRVKDQNKPIKWYERPNHQSEQSERTEQLSNSKRPENI